MDRLGLDNFSRLQMNVHVLHRARAHLKANSGKNISRRLKERENMNVLCLQGFGLAPRKWVAKVRQLALRARSPDRKVFV